ncbi:MAG TPA: bifunctional riboflavin kinase/FAD synthetase [Rubrivivax sp.]|jgi:riboflavin kinase/FMN adenylyltransferase|nr:bifunctional riboflavin kinase/FAD synthetase [Rhodoferax sp.]MCP5290883.1 bifunctional riboflavin kinase/FAD synthetase [Burkholderiaceae bacterium]HMR69815.1 bifunctional riboflavin kinase/FAD synthetase [Rubrivivax sp.]
MKILRGLHGPAPAGPCALTIGSFDGVHRGHQAMLALLASEARHRGLPACVMTFEPHPREFFHAHRGGAPPPPRIATQRDKLAELARCGVDLVALLRFDERLASLPALDFVDRILCRRLQARYVLVGDDFRFGARRAGDYALLDSAGARCGFDVARMQSYEVHGLRVSSSAVRDALAAGDMRRTAELLGRPYAISGRVLHGRKLGRDLGFRTLNLRFGHPRPAAKGIFVARVQGLAAAALPAVCSLGVRPAVEADGRVLLETHVLDWPGSLGVEGGYGRLITVELLHKLHDERAYPSLDALREGIARDVRDARDWFAAHSPSATAARG